MKPLTLAFLLILNGFTLLSAQGFEDRLGKPLSPKSDEEIMALNQVRPLGHDEYVIVSADDKGNLQNNPLTIASIKGKAADGSPSLLYKTGTTWSPLPFDLMYFHFEAGYEYELLYDKSLVDSDAEQFVYSLVRVVAKTRKESDIRAEAEKPPFYNTTWHIVSFNGKDTGGGMLFEGDQLTLLTGCNNVYGITWKEKRDKITFNTNDYMMTSKGCLAENAYYLENNLPKALAKIKRFEAGPHFLKLYDEDGLVVELKR